MNRHHAMTLRGVVRYVDGALRKSLSGLAPKCVALELVEVSCNDLRAAGLDDTGTYYVGLMERAVTQIRGADETGDGSAVRSLAPGEIELLKSIWGLDAYLRTLAGPGQPPEADAGTSAAR